MERKTGLILALDVTDRGRALNIAKATAGHLDAIKVNYPLALACGMEIVRDLAKDAYVLCDFKVADIPNTNRLIVERAIASGASGVVCHAFAGSDSVKACVDAAKGREIFVVTEMSHPGGQQFTGRLADELAKVAVEAGAKGVIAPATRPDRIAHIRKIIGKLEILSPGVGAQGGSASDALKAGADHIIVGRSIYEASDPAKVAKHLVEEAQKQF
ncbi:MAG: orotidine-5'-phosphate decarboxylase [Euryarchaeota archaeon]|nr:orotidine-5'-phosphate decarboxylase [Euryarchaeota archaeon]